MSAEDQFLAVCNRVLHVEATTLEDGVTLASIPAWDSFNALMLIAELEKEFGIKFAPHDASGIQTIGDIKKVLRAKGVEV